MEVEDIDLLLSTVKDIADYTSYRRILNVGLTINALDLPFEKVEIFSKIKEYLDVSKVGIRSSNGQKPTRR